MSDPLTAQELFDALRAEGCNPQEYRSWRTHERDDETGKPFGPVNGVVIHHTAGINSLAGVYDGRVGLPGPLCHTHLSKAGVVTMVSAGRANHAGTFAQNAHDAVVNESAVHPAPDEDEPVDGNDHYYGIEIENLGDGEDVYPWGQYVKAVKWATAICRAHGWSHNSTIGHKEGTRRKIDPKGPVAGPEGGLFTFTMGIFREDVQDALALPAGVWPNEEADVALTNEDAQKVWDVDYVPAARPPYANPDYADGNILWSAKYAARAAVEAAREAAAVAKAVEAKVDALAVAGVDLDALAVKVANEIYRRMAS